MPRLAFGPVRAPNMPIFEPLQDAAPVPPAAGAAVSPPLVPQAPRASAATASGTANLRVERTDVLLMSHIPQSRAVTETRPKYALRSSETLIGDRVVTCAFFNRAGPAPETGSGCRKAVDDGLGDLFHPEATVHRGLLDPPERIGLAQLE